MRDFSKYKEIGKTNNSVLYTVESDPDVMVLVPHEGTIDTAKDARENVALVYQYADTLGKPIGIAVIMANLLSQDPEARRTYAGVDPGQTFGAALVVESALSRALGSFFVGLSRPAVPLKLFDTLENAIEWLKTMRPQ